jgi:hypothetical protein
MEASASYITVMDPDSYSMSTVVNIFSPDTSTLYATVEDAFSANSYLPVDLIPTDSLTPLLRMTILHLL